MLLLPIRRVRRPSSATGCISHAYAVCRHCAVDTTLHLACCMSCRLRLNTVDRQAAPVPPVSAHCMSRPWRFDESASTLFESMYRVRICRMCDKKSIRVVESNQSFVDRQPRAPRSARLGSARLGSARLGSARLGSARRGAAWRGSARLGSARLGKAAIPPYADPVNRKQHLCCAAVLCCIKLCCDIL